MANKEFILQRICIFAGMSIDPDSDEQVTDLLRSKFDIRLPQRRSLNESLESCISDHAIIKLIVDYRNMKKGIAEHRENPPRHTGPRLNSRS